ncbi:MAG: diaminopimelate decarboxylase [Anaerolineae bacterium]|nr:diaminopimelate decarboxylase [Anaerolineae bacterium]
MLDDVFRYQAGELTCDGLPIRTIVEAVGTPVYIYSLKGALANLRRLQAAFAELGAHIHYSAKANGNLSVLRALIGAGAGIDCVSAGEIFLALKAGAQPSQIVLAGVGKTPEELCFAVEQGVGWVNVENVAECALLEQYAAALGRSQRIALRLNPDVSASTHRHIATGHGGAKFGLTADVVRHLLDTQGDYPHLRFEGIHIHIGSQLGDTAATLQAVEEVLKIARAYPSISTIDIGGGLPVAYERGQIMPQPEAFADALAPLLKGYDVILEPGRSIIANAGILVARVLYLKEQGGHKFVVLDAGMTELIRPALYEAHHEIVPLVQPAADAPCEPVEVVGPVCETTDALAHGRPLPPLAPGEHVALMTAGAYGYVMASNYNARPRPPEVVIEPDGETWRIARPRETWEDLIRGE